MAKIPIKKFAEQYGFKVTQVYTLIKKRPHLKVKEKGLGTLIDTTKYEKIVA